MTPLEISEYKNRWMSTGNPYSVEIHSDFSDPAKAWCKRNLERYEWTMTSWTDVYEHTLFFEKRKSGENFEMAYRNRFKL